MKKALFIVFLALAACGKEKCTSNECDPNERYTTKYNCKAANREGVFSCYDTPETYTGYRQVPAKLYKDCQEIANPFPGTYHAKEFTCLRLEEK